MAKVLAGRHTARVEDPVAVFLIGMRINQLFAVHRWWPVFIAMGPMLRELARFPEKGLLHSRVYWSGRTVLLVQYWRSFEHLEKFARNPNDPHLPAFGLGAATQIVPVNAGSETARRRVGAAAAD